MIWNKTISFGHAVQEAMGTHIDCPLIKEFAPSSQESKEDEVPALRSHESLVVQTRLLNVKLLCQLFAV
jgi:hypothetical protein